MVDDHRFDDVAAQVAGQVFRAPESLLVRRSERGLGLFVDRAVAAGEVIYESGWWTIPDAEHCFEVQVEVDGVVETVLITKLHTVQYADTRSLDIPGCFMNHACDPNSRSVDIVPAGERVAPLYQQVALRDLSPGDEITCDYTLYDWTCDGHQFTCACGASDCFGEIRGFEALPPDVQQQRAQWTCCETARMLARRADL